MVPDVGTARHLADWPTIRPQEWDAERIRRQQRLADAETALDDTPQIAGVDQVDLVKWAKFSEYLNRPDVVRERAEQRAWDRWGRGDDQC